MRKGNNGKELYCRLVKDQCLNNSLSLDTGQPAQLQWLSSILDFTDFFLKSICKEISHLLSSRLRGRIILKPLLEEENVP